MKKKVRFILASVNKGRLFASIWIVCLLLCVYSCKQKGSVTMQLNNVFTPKEKAANADEHIMFLVSIKNTTEKNVSIDNLDIERPGTWGFFLVSNALYTGAVKLRLSSGSKIKNVKHGQSENATALLDVELLKRTLVKGVNERLSYEDVKRFLSGDNFSLTYMSDTLAVTVPRSPKFKVVLLDSATDIRSYLK